MSRFFLALLIFGLGFALMKYSYNVMQFFGRLEWAESTLGGGGTFTFYKLLGLFFMIGALFHLFGVWPILLSPLTGIFGGR